MLPALNGTGYRSCRSIGGHTPSARDTPRRYRPVPYAARTVSAGRQPLIETEADTTYVVLDESGNGTAGRAQIVGAIVTRDIATLNLGIRRLAETHRESPQVGGKRQFRTFDETGFHFADNPREIQAVFGEYLAGLNGYRAFMSFSSGQRLPEVTEDERFLILYATILADIFAYARTGKIVFLFETNTSLSKKFRKLVERCKAVAAGRSPHRAMPDHSVFVVGKADVEALSIIDYCMAYVSQWIAAGLQREPDQFQFTAYKNVEANVASLLDFDSGLRSTRRSREFH
jgi:hypothetical protein